MADQLFRIPLDPVPQTFTIELNGTGYAMACRWNDAAQVWFLDIADSVTGTALISGLPLVTGGDLLSQFRHIIPEGMLFCYTDGDPSEAPPTLDNLGSTSNLYFYLP
jgi:hypothetical protein